MLYPAFQPKHAFKFPLKSSPLFASRILASLIAERHCRSLANLAADCNLDASRECLALEDSHKSVSDAPEKAVFEILGNLGRIRESVEAGKA